MSFSLAWEKFWSQHFSFLTINSKAKAPRFASQGQKKISKFTVEVFKKAMSSQGKETTGKDGLELLFQDHRCLEDLFSQYEQLIQSDSKDADTFDHKRQLVKQIVRELGAHASAEERFVYPLYRTNLPNGDAIANCHILDHHVDKEMMQVLENMDPRRDGGLYDHTVQKLIMMTKDHVQQEEMFLNNLRGQLNSSELENLADSIVRAKEKAPLHPHPEAPSKPSNGAGLVQPLTGSIERMVEK